MKIKQVRKKTRTTRSKKTSECLIPNNKSKCQHPKSCKISSRKSRKKGTLRKEIMKSKNLLDNKIKIVALYHLSALFNQNQRVNKNSCPISLFDMSHGFQITQAKLAKIFNIYVHKVQTMDKITKKDKENLDFRKKGKSSLLSREIKIQICGFYCPNKPINPIN